MLAHQAHDLTNKQAARHYSTKTTTSMAKFVVFCAEKKKTPLYSS